MTPPEPKTLFVGLSAWRISHALASPGTHRAADDCAWVPTTECEFAVAMATRLDAPDEEFTDLTVTPPAGSSAPPVPGAFAPQAVVEIPLAAPPVLLRVRATPTAKLTVKGQSGNRPDNVTGPAFFEGTAYFVYEGNAVWKRQVRSDEEDETNSADLFGPPMTLAGVLNQPFVYALVPFFCSRVRVRTRRALSVLHERYPDQSAFADPEAEFMHLDDPPVADGKVRMKAASITLDVDCRVLEIQGFKAPRLVAVCWPRVNDSQSGTGVAPFLRAEPMEALIFFHASNGQNAAIYNSTPYPFGVEQMDHGFLSYLNAVDHPLRKVYPLSLPYQIAAAGKRAALILPLNRVPFPELTNLEDGEQAAELLEEIQAAMLRLAGHYFWAPRLGRIALGSFSAGIQELLSFHRGAAKVPLLKSLIEEVYIFEPKHSNAAEVANYANGFKAWAGTVPARRVRVYSNESGDGLRDFVGAKLPATPFVADSADGRFTSGVVGDREWLPGATGRDAVFFDFRRDLATADVAKSAPRGSASVEFAPKARLTVGMRLINPLGDFHRVVAVQGKTGTLDPPLLRHFPAGGGFFVVDRIAFETRLTDHVVPGDRLVEVADPAAFFEDGFLIVDDAIGRYTGSPKGNQVPVTERFTQSVVRGSRVGLFECCVRTTLRSAHPAGSTTLNVFAAKAVDFRPGDSITIGLQEPAKVKAVTDDTILLEQPTSRDWPTGDYVGKTSPRRMAWGSYHSLFVTVFLTDAMRKSGFR